MYVRDPLTYTGLRARSLRDAGVPSRSGQAVARDEQRPSLACGSASASLLHPWKVSTGALTARIHATEHSRVELRFARHAASVDDGLSYIRHVRHADVAETWSYSLGSSAIASIETSRPWGRRTCAGAERAGGGSGMWRA